MEALNYIYYIIVAIFACNLVIRIITRFQHLDLNSLTSNKIYYDTLLGFLIVLVEVLNGNTNAK